MDRTRPKTTGDTSGSKTTCKEATSRGYKTTNKVDNNYDSDVSTNTPKPVVLGRGRGNRSKAGNTILQQRQKACNTSLLTDQARAGDYALSRDILAKKSGVFTDNTKKDR